MNRDIFKPMTNQSVVDRIIERIIDALIRRELLPGEKIPTETELCESMHVGRNSVREAIKVLVAMGVLQIRRSEGTFVCEGFSDKMLNPLVYGMILEGGNTAKIIELRKIFDAGVLQLAAEKGTTQDVQKLRDSLAKLQQRAETEDEQAILDADVQFHSVLEGIVDNMLMATISTVIARLTKPTRLLAVRNFIEKRELALMIQLHEEIISVIEHQDIASVWRVIDEHYKYWKGELV